MFANLNASQREAVETIFGPVLVVAGPGTGKTQLLTARIAHILKKTDVGPQGILCLTFTENGATEMRRRLQQWIGAEAYRVKIQTFHGFCESILQDYTAFFEDTTHDFTLADDLERALIFRKVIDKKPWVHLKPFNDKYYYQRAFLGAISELKREDLNPRTFLDLIPAEKERLLNDPGNFYKRDSKYGKKGDLKAGLLEKIEKKIEKMGELSQLWEDFEAEKVKQKKYDFDDQIGQVLETLKNNPTLKSELQERYQFILVDEYQDTNNSQNTILWQLSDFFDDPNLFVVGDDDQAIYRFQGASLQNILEFETRFPKAKRIELSENYRSSQPILDSSYHSVGKNFERLNSEKTLTAAGQNKSKAGKIYRAEFMSRSSELIWMSEQITQLMTQGTPAREIAILVRENREASEISRYLNQFGVKISNRTLDNIFVDPLITSFIQLLTVWQNPSLDYVFYEMLHAPFWNLSPEALLSINIEARGNKHSIATELQKQSNTNVELKRIWEMIAQLRKDYRQSPSLIISTKLFHQSGLAAWINQDLKHDKQLMAAKFNKLFQWVEQQQYNGLDLKQILERITLHQELNIPIFPDPLPGDRNAVQIMTAHKAKGLEFEAVFIPGLLDKTWGNKRARNLIALPQINVSDHDPNEDERRLFFVALTRAKSQLFLSYAQQDLSGREKNPSEFWHEIPEGLITQVETDSAEDQAHQLLPIFLQAPETPLLTGGEEAVLQRLVKNFVWSASSLQNYLDCPRKFLYVNLLKVPTPPKKIFGYGSAIHEALEVFIGQYRLTQKSEFSELEHAFQAALIKQNMTTLERKEAEAHGNEILKKYHATLLPKLPETGRWLLEADFRTEIKNIPVYGRIDKVEIADNKGILVDYKSGKPKRIVTGERLWRQLVFYDLLIEHTPRLPWKAQGFELEWLTPDAKDQFIRTPLEITTEDRTQVLKELQEVHQKVLKLEFPMVLNTGNDVEIDYWQNFGSFW